MLRNTTEIVLSNTSLVRAACEAAHWSTSICGLLGWESHLWCRGTNLVPGQSVVLNDYNFFQVGILCEVGLRQPVSRGQLCVWTLYKEHLSLTFSFNFMHNNDFWEVRFALTLTESSLLPGTQNQWCLPFVIATAVICLLWGRWFKPHHERTARVRHTDETGQRSKRHGHIEWGLQIHFYLHRLTVYITAFNPVVIQQLMFGEKFESFRNLIS